ncbi:MAG: hypothetical protein DDT19_00664 [Syntrophomonadaceae bacterium]|nr:hypothetical protein [Bacillota bacterium]
MFRKYSPQELEISRRRRNALNAFQKLGISKKELEEKFSLLGHSPLLKEDDFLKLTPYIRKIIIERMEDGVRLEQEFSRFHVHEFGEQLSATTQPQGPRI